MSKTGTKGSLSDTQIVTNSKYKFSEIAYVFSRTKQIENLYQKLRLIYARDLNDTNYSTYKDFCKKHKIDFHLMPILKELKVCDDSGKWIKEYPSKGDAIIISLKLRQKHIDIKSEKSS